MIPRCCIFIRRAIDRLEGNSNFQIFSGVHGNGGRAFLFQGFYGYIKGSEGRGKPLVKFDPYHFK